MASLIARLTAAFQAVRDKINTLPKRYSVTIGDGATKDFIVTHNLNNQDVMARCRLAASPYTEVIPDYYYTDANTLTVKFGNPPTANQYRITVVG